MKKYLLMVFVFTFSYCTLLEDTESLGTIIVSRVKSLESYIWQVLEHDEFSVSKVDWKSLEITPNRTSYITYTNEKDMVIKYNGSAWGNIAKAGFSSRRTEWMTLSILPPIGIPQNIKLVNNKNLTKNIGISWDSVPNAKGYAIYIATLDHQNSQYARLIDSDYKKVGESKTPNYTIDFGIGTNPPLYPIRRHAIMIKVIDSANSEGVGTTYRDTVYRLPVDVLDFGQRCRFYNCRGSNSDC